jgi:hypothetical protein
MPISGLATDSTQLQILYKKYNAVANTDAQKDYSTEYNIDATPNVLLNKIYTESIPPTAPDLCGTQIMLRSDPSEYKQYGIGSNSHIVKYTDVRLSPLWGNSDSAFVFDITNGTGATNEDASDNILSNTISSKYDPKGSYGITVSDSDGQRIIAAYYIFDRDAGVLTIYDLPLSRVDRNKPPKVTFWRYEGKIGQVGASGWASQAATQNVDMSGYTLTGLRDTSESDISSVVVTKGYLISKLAGLDNNWYDVSAASNVEMSGNRFKHLGDASDVSDAVTLGQLTTKLSLYATLSGDKVMTGKIDMCGSRIEALGDPSDISDAANKGYVDSSVSKWANYKAVKTLDMSGYDICGVANIYNSSVTVSGETLTLKGKTTQLTGETITLCGSTVSLASLSGDLAFSSSADIKLAAGSAKRIIVGSDISMNGKIIIAGVSGSFDFSDNNAVNKAYVDSKLASMSTGQDWSKYGADQDISMNNYLITGMRTTTGTDLSDAVNVDYLKQYVPSGANKGDYLYYNGSKWTVGSDKVLIGTGAVSFSGKDQSGGAIAIGENAGLYGQQSNAIAIGKNAYGGTSGQFENSIIINATGVTLPGTLDNRFYVKPIRDLSGSGDIFSKTLYYNSTTGEIAYSDMSSIYQAIEAAAGNAALWSTNAAQSDVNMGGSYRITNMADPSGSKDAVTLSYAETNFLKNPASNKYKADALNLADVSQGIVLPSKTTAAQWYDLSRNAAPVSFVQSEVQKWGTSGPGYNYKPTTDIDMSGFKITGLSQTLSTVSGDAVSVAALNSTLSTYATLTGISGNYVKVTDISNNYSTTTQMNLAISGEVANWANYAAIRDVSMNSFFIRTTKTLEEMIDASNNVLVSKAYVDEKVRGVSSGGDWSAFNAKQIVDMSGNRIKSLADPVDLSDAANKGYVDKIQTWLDTYVINGPPAPTLPVATNSSTEVLLKFKNPVQITAGAFNTKLPALTKIYADISYNTGTQATILDNCGTLVPGVTEISGIRIIKSGDNSTTGYSNGIYTIKSPNLTVDNQSSTQFTLRIGYRNGSNQATNYLTTLVGPFVSSGAPSIPQGPITFSSTTQTSTTANWKAVAYYDNVNSVALKSSDNITYSYQLIQTGSQRYHGEFPFTRIRSTLPKTSNISGDAVQLNLSSLNPGSTYRLDISASNGYGYSSIINNTFTTSVPPEENNIEGISLSSFSNGTYTNATNAKSINGTTITVPIVNINSSSIAFTPLLKIDAHRLSNAGSADTASIMDICGVVTVAGGGNTYPSNTRSILGFGSTSVNQLITGKEFYINAVSELDRYNVIPSTNNQTGFYKTTDIYPALDNTTKLPATYNKYTVTLKTTQYPSNTVRTATGEFYVDDLNTAPTSGVTASINNSIESASNIVYISGVKIIKKDTNIIATVGINNLISYFYAGSNIAKFTLTTHDSQQISSYTVNSFSDGSLAPQMQQNTKYSGTATVSTNSFTINTTNKYTKYIQLEVKASSIYTANALLGTTPIRYMIDPLSEVLVTNIGATANNSITTTNSSMYGRLSETADNTYSLSETYNNYNHLTVIYGANGTSNNHTLQIVNGKFRTYANDSSNAYLNYTDSNINKLISNDYSSSSWGALYESNNGIYRYATFSFNVGAVDNGNNLYIYINNVSPTLANNSSDGETVYINGADSNIANRKAFELYYRIVGTGVNPATSTVWVNANTIESTPTLANMTDSTKNKQLGGRNSTESTSTSFNMNGNNAQYKLLLPSGISAKSYTLYVRIGVPMNVNFEFESIKATVG